jgi:hypothetical protein
MHPNHIPHQRTALRSFDLRCDFIRTGVLVDEQKISLPAALQAQSALRSSAGLGPELFPIPEFVGMISSQHYAPPEARNAFKGGE